MKSNAFHLETYRRMLRIRQFEANALKLAETGDIPGALHVTAGQEGAIVGACMALNTDDYMLGTHRSHGHPIGKGAGLPPLMAELMGKKTGVCQGKGGSMHLADFSVGSLGETSIVGSGLPVATGAALGAKMQKSGRVSLAFFGDGASNEGTFHESLNLAAVWKLPVIFFCENNLYAVTTRASDVLAVEDIAVRSTAYGIPGHVVDGQDVLAVYEVVRQAVERARNGEGPSLIEAKTYRYFEHSRSMKNMKYRPQAEVDDWLARDPIDLFRAHLLAERMVSAEEFEAIGTEVDLEIAGAIKFAKESPNPDQQDAYDHMFANPVI